LVIVSSFDIRISDFTAKRVVSKSSPFSEDEWTV